VAETRQDTGKKALHAQKDSKIKWTVVMKEKRRMTSPRALAAVVVPWSRSLLLFRVSVHIASGYYILISGRVAHAVQRSSSRKGVFLAKTKALCEEYKLDATQSCEEVRKYM
jgi:hypothetical protein